LLDVILVDVIIANEIEQEHYVGSWMA